MSALLGGAALPIGQVLGCGLHWEDLQRRYREAHLKQSRVPVLPVQVIARLASEFALARMSY